jgi:3-hydroxyacyl-[acyl-carrier-protein] dehydratase
VSDRARDAGGLDLSQILGVLPHRFPWVMVDRVTSIQTGKSIRGTKCVAYNEPWFAGHSPQKPAMPGMLVLESLTQIATILAYASDPFDRASSMLYFLGIDKAKLRRMAVPGDRIDLEVDVLHHQSNVWSFRGEASVDGQLCAEAELVASVVERPT